MGIAFGTRSAWVSDVLTDVGKVVASSGLAPADLVVETLANADETLDEPKGEVFFCLYPGSVDTSGGVSDGAPDSWTHAEMTIAVEVNARITKDPRGTSAAVLKETNRGFSDLTKKLAKKLHRSNLALADNSYLFEPARVVRVEFPRKPRWTAWTRAVVLVSVKFRADFS